MIEILSRAEINKFQKIIRNFYSQNSRQMLWRNPEVDGSYDPYKILVSEIMLQQTQVARVNSKIIEFLEKFKTVGDLAAAELGDVLSAWSGLGYNRRAQYVHNAAKKLTTITTPWTLLDLTGCIGIGHNTAAAVIAYAYDTPVVFVETNIRTVVIHHFFNQESNVADKDILNIVKQTLPDTAIREWYYGLMDYGAFIKNSVGNASRKSRSYSIQTKFDGSKRQLRGSIIKLLKTNDQTLEMFQAIIADYRLVSVLNELAHEGLIHQNNKYYKLG